MGSSPVIAKPFSHSCFDCFDLSLFVVRLQSFTWGIYKRKHFLFVFWNFLLITRYFKVRVELQTL